MKTIPTKQALLDQGIAMLLRHGYHDLGIVALLEAVDVPKGSFYHHFTTRKSSRSKQSTGTCVTCTRASMRAWGMRV